MQHDDRSRLSGQRYPTTHLSLIQQLRDHQGEARRRAYDLLIAAYWRPVYTHLRLRWNKDRPAAEDLTQEFFALAFEKAYFDSFDPAKARFRTFVRTCVDRFAAKDHRKSETVKRGGTHAIVPLDYTGVEAELQARAGESPDDIFERQWVRSVFDLAVSRLKEECAEGNRSVACAMFRLYDLEEDSAVTKLSYAELAARFGVKETDVTNYLAAMRRRFRQLVLEVLRQLTSSEEEYREEARLLLGVNPE